MNPSPNAIGQAVYIRTDTMDYEEKAIPFNTLEDMVALCATPQPNLTLEKIVIYSMVGDQPTQLTLGFISASRGQRPNHPEFAAND